MADDCIRLQRQLAVDERGHLGVRIDRAEYLAWSAVHGLAMLIIDGPLGHLGAEPRRLVEERLLALVEKGL